MKKYILTFLFCFYCFLSFADKLSSINFEKGKIEPSKDEKEMLYILLDELQDYELASFIVIGHTDAYECKDSVEAMNLSRERVYFCRNFLIENGVDSCRLKIEFYGANQPKYPNTVNGIPDKFNQSANRRVEVYADFKEYTMFAQARVKSINSLITLTKEFKNIYPKKHIVICAYGDKSEDIREYLEYEFLFLDYISMRNLEKEKYTMPTMKIPEELEEYATHIVIDVIKGYNFENSDNFYVFVLEWMCEE